MYANQLPAALDTINQTVIRTQNPITIEEPALMQDGSTAIFLSNKVPLYNHQGKVMGMAGISIDITERKKAEAQLKEAKVAAEAGERAKTAFLYNMRHDLRTPFSGLLSLALILKDKETDPEKKYYLINIAGSAQVLLNHLNDILDYIHSYDGHLVVVEKHFSPKKLLQDLCIMMEPAAHKKNLLLMYECDPNLPSYITGDFLRTQRILIHLLANAIQFTEKGQVTLKGGLISNDTDKATLQFIVEDTGSGIPDGQQELIFEQFHRLMPSYQTNHTGMGLGLSTVKQFLNDLGGKINLQSQVGKGSKFELIIPYHILRQGDKHETS